jgi:hypothetical protein
VADVDLGKLLRLKGMIDSAASAVEADAASAPALTESYQRLREQVEKTLSGSDLLAEFQASFPELPTVEGPTGSEHPREVVSRARVAESAARKARALLGQLAGWVDGMIAERTLEKRLQAEAVERVKQEKQRPGFRAS